MWRDELDVEVLGEFAEASSSRRDVAEFGTLALSKGRPRFSAIEKQPSWYDVLLDRRRLGHVQRAILLGVLVESVASKVARRLARSTSNVSNALRILAGYQLVRIEKVRVGRKQRLLAFPTADGFIAARSVKYDRAVIDNRGNAWTYDRAVIGKPWRDR